LETNSTNNFSVVGIELVLQEEVAFKQGEVGRHAKKCVA
jgi:hypothetical protein